MGAETSLSGWALTGFQVVMATWGWALVVLLHAVWRAFQGPETDPIREAGPGA